MLVTLIGQQILRGLHSKEGKVFFFFILISQSNFPYLFHFSIIFFCLFWGFMCFLGGVSSRDWLHVTLSLLYHDIGYIKGICMGDKPEEDLYVNGKDPVACVSLPKGATDAALTHYHVDRGKLFVRERFKGHSLINAEELAKNIEYTRFPVPKDEDPKDVGLYPGIVISPFFSPLFMIDLGACGGFVRTDE